VTLQQFADACNLNSLQEAEKVCHFAFFYFKTQNTQEFSVADAARWLKSYGLPAPNTSRLDRKLKELRNVLIRSSSGFRLHVNYVTEMQTKYPALGEKSQEVIEHGTVLSDLDFRNTRGYIESLAKQINASYENNIFDGCGAYAPVIGGVAHLDLPPFEP
jgi:hypothetical protein